MAICVGRTGRAWCLNQLGKVNRATSVCVSVISVRETAPRHHVGQPYRYSCPLGSRMDTSDESRMVGVGRPPLGAWLLGFPRCDVTSGGVIWPALMKGFSGGRRCGPLDLEDLTVEIVSNSEVPGPYK